MGELQKRIKENLDVIPKPVLVALQEWVEEMCREHPEVDVELIKRAQTAPPTLELMKEVIMSYVDLAYERGECFKKWFGADEE